MVPRSKISILAQMMRTSFQVHLIFASFLRRRTPCQQLTAFLQNNLRWGNLFVLLFLTFPSLWPTTLTFYHPLHLCLLLQAEIFKSRLGLTEGEIVRPLSPDLARAEVAGLVSSDHYQDCVWHTKLEPLLVKRSDLLSNESSNNLSTIFEGARVQGGQLPGSGKGGGGERQ